MPFLPLLLLLAIIIVTVICIVHIEVVSVIVAVVRLKMLIDRDTFSRYTQASFSIVFSPLLLLLFLSFCSRLS